MEIIRDEEFRKGILEKIAQREFSERTGVHGSDLIYCLNLQALRRLNPVASTDEEVLTFSLGWSTQRWLTNKAEDEEGIELDGITVTPDVVLDGCPWELKATYMSSEKPIIENLHWLRQLMAQCKVTGATTAYLSRLGIMGDWKWVFKPKGFKDWDEEQKQQFNSEHSHPILDAHRIEFTQGEVDQNWEWLKERKQLFETVVSTGVLLSRQLCLPSGMEFLCGRCHYKPKECYA